MSQNENEKEYISGTLERITYHNSDNGYAILKVFVKGYKDLVTIVGNIATISVGEYLKCQGVWFNDKNYGLQFKAEFIQNLPPNSLKGIEKYLGSGLIKGIGPVYAKKLVDAFGESVFDVIENEPSKLRKINGVGKWRCQTITDNWSKQKVVREIMVFLQSHGVGTARATRIYKTYGDDAIKLVSENPYRLARDIKGIGFVSSDQIARNLGIPANSIIRARSGISHILLEGVSNGHCGLPKEELIANTMKLLEVERTLVEDALMAELQEKMLISDSVKGTEAIFLPPYYYYENGIARMLCSLKEKELPWNPINTEKAISWVQEELNIELASNQRLALACALSNKVMVITGGPGTGKTTLVNSVLRVLREYKVSIRLCAPTGRAAKRMTETTKMPAQTIHRMLGVNQIGGGFIHNEDNKLNCEYLVVDESSMIDVPLFFSLLKALPERAGLLLVGDVDQLPSVGAGFVLGNIINSRSVIVVKLNEVFRQASSSNIVLSAHSVNKGIIPKLQYTKEEESDFYFLEAEDEGLPAKLISLVKDRLPKTFGYNPLQDIQILAPMQRGSSGVRSLNVALQKALNPFSNITLSKFGQNYAVGDKVMQTENNYDQDVFNGDMGIIDSINEEEQEVVINFDGKNVTYDYSDLDQITLAYAITIHKSQGSEYPVVIIPITMQSYVMLQRNLIYTGITRGRKLVIILGQKKALSIAVRNNKGVNRYTRLEECLGS